MTSEKEIRAPIPERGYLTIREAKEFRCGHSDCEKLHSTCRRCGKHLVMRHFLDIWNILEVSGFCSECHREYQKWKIKRNRELYELWNAESDDVKKEFLEAGHSPLFWREEYLGWMKAHKIVEANFTVIE